MNIQLDPSHTALLVIDVQQSLFERRTPIYNANTFLDNLDILTVRFDQARALCVFIQHANSKMLVKGTPGWQLHSDLWLSENAVLVNKTHGNAFKETNLDALLKENGIDTVVVTGLVTLGCVRATCKGAVTLNYRTILVSDAHSSYHKNAAQRIKDWNLEFAANDGLLVGTEKLVF